MNMGWMLKGRANMIRMYIKNLLKVVNRFSITNTLLYFSIRAYQSDDRIIAHLLK